MPNRRKFTIEFKVKAVELAKKLGRSVASLRVLDGVCRREAKNVQVRAN